MKCYCMGFYLRFAGYLHISFCRLEIFTSRNISCWCVCFRMASLVDICLLLLRFLKWLHQHCVFSIMLISIYCALYFRIYIQMHICFKDAADSHSVLILGYALYFYSFVPQAYIIMGCFQIPKFVRKYNIKLQTTDHLVQNRKQTLLSARVNSG